MTARQSSAGEITITWNYDSVVKPTYQRIRVIEEPSSNNGKPSGKGKVVSSKELPMGAARYVVRNLAAGKAYRVELISSSPSLKLTSRVVLVPRPAAITGLAATWVDGELLVTWNVPRSADNTLVGVAVSSATGFRREAAASATSGGVRITGADPKTTYKVIALAKNPAGTGPITQIGTASALPGRANVTVGPNGVGNVTLRWTTTGTPASQWVITIIAPGQARHDDTVILSGRTSAEIDKLTPGAEYAFKVTGRSSLGDGPSSELVRITAPTALPRPTLPSVSAATSSGSSTGAVSVKVSWAAVVASGGATISYRVAYRLAGSTEWSYTPGTDSLTTTVSLIGNPAGQPYEVLVEASTVDNRTSRSTVTVFEVPQLPADQPSTTPSSGSDGSSTNPPLPATPLVRFEGTAGSSSVTVYWDEQPVPVQIRYRTANTLWGNVSVSGSSKVIGGLTNGSTYEIILVTASDSTPISRMLSLTPLGVSSPPLSLTAVPRHSEVELSWNPPADTGGTSLIGYVVTYSSTSGTGQRFLDPFATSVVVTGLINGERYDFSVRLETQFGQGSFSSVAATPAAS